MGRKKTTIPHLARFIARRSTIVGISALAFFLSFCVVNLPGSAAGTAGPQQRNTLSISDLPASLQESIERSSYQVVQDPGEPGLYHANNPRQGLRATFSTRGVQVTVGDSKAEWNMQLAAYGRIDHVSPATAANIVVDRERIEYRRHGITEWYVNSGSGIEQGFTLHQRPGGDGTLVVDLRVSGGLEAERVGEDLVFHGAGARLGYAKLHAFDATGRPLASRMELVSSGETARAGGGLLVRLSVEDRGARYPVVIDPILTNVKKITASDADGGDLFGQSVSISGDTAIVGSPYNDDGGTSSGSAYIYQRQAGLGTGNWNEVRKLTASDAAYLDFFGWSVAISGDTAIVGSPSFSTAGSTFGSAARRGRHRQLGRGQKDHSL